MSEILRDHDAERAVLGAIMLDRRCLSDVATELEPDDFNHPAHREVYAAAVALDAASAPLDAVSVVAWIRMNGEIDRLSSVGGPDFVAMLALDAASMIRLGYHAKAIARKAERRRWVEAATKIVVQGKQNSDDDEFLREAESALMALTTRKRSGGPVAIKPVMHAVAGIIEKRYERRHEHAITGVPSGLEQVDTLTLGWQPSDMVVIAGRPSMGKTAMAMTVAVEAVRSGHAALVFSLEMSKEALAERMIAMEGAIDSNVLRTGQIESKTWIQLTKTFARIADWPLWVEDQTPLTISQICSRARRWRMNDAAKFKSVMVVVDYIGLVRPDKEHNQRTREVAQVSQGLKALAKSLAAPVIGLSQLNRDCETRQNKRPMLSDLRESGDIEQDADVIAFLYRDDYYHDKPTGQCERCAPGVAEVIIAKQRNGATGCAHVGWRPQFTKFVNISERDGR